MRKVLTNDVKYWHHQNHHQHHEHQHPLKYIKSVFFKTNSSWIQGHDKLPEAKEKK